jgi:syntaxin 16
MGISVKSKDSNDRLLGESGYEMEDVESGKENKITVAPPWMHIVDEVNYDISRIKAKMTELSNAHGNHLKPQFVAEDMEDEQTIEILTEQITKMFQQSQAKLARLGKERVQGQEISIRKNLQSSLASQLQELSIQFRKDQKDYLQRLKGRQQKGKIGFNVEEDAFEDDANFQVTFTGQQAAMVQSTEDLVSQREREIRQIAKSIVELSSIFKDLATLVIEQGTILDRIDYNVEQVDHNVSKGLEQLREAGESQKSYRNKLCMLLLCIAVLIMVIVVIVKGIAG